MEFKKYVEEELKYYDDHPEEDDYVIEAHSNSDITLEVDFSASQQTVYQLSSIYYKPVTYGFFCAHALYNRGVHTRLTMTYEFTEHEDEALVQMLSFFLDVGVPDEMDQDAFDSLSEKVFNS